MQSISGKMVVFFFCMYQKMLNKKFNEPHNSILQMKYPINIFNLKITHFKIFWNLNCSMQAITSFRAKKNNLKQY